MQGPIIEVNIGRVMDAISETLLALFVDDDWIVEMYQRRELNQTINNASLKLIDSFEGLRLTSYEDSVGVFTSSRARASGYASHPNFGL